MRNPGAYSLGDFSITAVGTLTGEWVTNLEGMLKLTLQLALAYGSGGTSIKAYLQTSFDQSTPVDIACVVFGTAGETALINLSGLTPKTTQVNPSDGALTDDTAIDGLLGDRVRLKVVVAGTYAGSTILRARAVAA